jgi:lipopolysaccharide export system permease protein
LKLNSYLFKQISLAFIPIFLGLLFITSIIYLVKISALTSIIDITIYELFILYLYHLPIVLFYTLPISFFISIGIAISKLSSEYELIIISSLGLNPLKIIKTLLPITIIFTICILIISLGLIPKTKYLKESMLNTKKKEASFNIKDSQFGQKFGTWMVYIKEKKLNRYNNIKLFTKHDIKNKQDFILSKEATVVNNKGSLSLTLKDGKYFQMSKNKLDQVNFKEMQMNNDLTISSVKKYESIILYWYTKIKYKQDIDDFVFYILISIFPLISLLLILSFGYFNPRYEKNHTISYSLLSITIYYLITNYLAKNIYLYAFYVPIIWFYITYIVYNRKIKYFY